MRFASPAIRVLALSFALACGTAGAAEAAEPRAEAGARAELRSPIAQPRAILDALRANDAEALVEATTDKPSSELAKEWERERVKISKREHANPGDIELVRVWSLLATDAGAQQLVDEWHPVLAENASSQVIAMNVGLAGALSGIASSAELRGEEVAQLSQLVVAVQAWASGMDWNDRARLERAVGAMSGFVQRSKLTTPAEGLLLPYEQALALGDDAIATVKRVLLAYDLDADATLASIAIDELERDGDRAIVRSRATVLGVPIEIVREMRYRGDIGSGGWLDRTYIEQYDKSMAAFEAQLQIEAAAEARVVKDHGADSGSCSPREDTDDSAKQWSKPPAQAKD